MFWLVISTIVQSNSVNSSSVSAITWNGYTTTFYEQHQANTTHPQDLWFWVDHHILVELDQGVWWSVTCLLRSSSIVPTCGRQPLSHSYFLCGTRRVPCSCQDGLWKRMLFPSRQHFSFEDKKASCNRPLFNAAPELVNSKPVCGATYLQSLPKSRTPFSA